MLCFESAETHTARIGIMFIHFDGSASAGSNAWPEIDSRLLKDGSRATRPPRRNASCAQSVGKLFWGRGRSAARRKLGSANCANCANPCMHRRRNPSPWGRGNCANCSTPFCLRNTGPYSGGKEFPVAAASSRAISCRIVAGAGRSADGQSAIGKTLAEIAETPIGKQCLHFGRGMHVARPLT